MYLTLLNCKKKKIVTSFGEGLLQSDLRKIKLQLK